VSCWINLCHTGLKTFGDKLTLDDILVEDETTQVGVGAGSGRATNEPGSSSR